MPTRKQTTEATRLMNGIPVCRNSVFLFLAFLLSGVVAYGQSGTRQVPHHAEKDRLTYQDFTIRVEGEQNESYRFDIFKDGKRLLHYKEEDLPTQEIITREDAFAAAKWMIDQYQKTGRMPSRIPRPLVRKSNANQFSKPKQTLQ